METPHGKSLFAHPFSLDVPFDLSALLSARERREYWVMRSC